MNSDYNHRNSTRERLASIQEFTAYTVQPTCTQNEIILTKEMKMTKFQNNFKICRGVRFIAV